MTIVEKPIWHLKDEIVYFTALYRYYQNRLSDIVKRDNPVKNYNDPSRVVYSPEYFELRAKKELCASTLNYLNKFQEQSVKPVNQWISVDDRLPDPGNRVLIFSVHKSMRDVTEINISYVNERKKWIAPRQYFFDCSKITHWMPLPEKQDV